MTRMRSSSGLLFFLFVLLFCVDVINIPTLIINTQFPIQTQMSYYLAVKKLIAHSQHTTKHTNINCNHNSFCFLFYILSNYFNVFVLLSMATNNGTTCYHHHINHHQQIHSRNTFQAKQQNKCSIVCVCGILHNKSHRCCC